MDALLERIPTINLIFSTAVFYVGARIYFCPRSKNQIIGRS